MSYIKIRKTVVRGAVLGGLRAIKYAFRYPISAENKKSLKQNIFGGKIVV